MCNKRLVALITTIAMLLMTTAMTVEMAPTMTTAVPMPITAEAEETMTPLGLQLQDKEDTEEQKDHWSAGYVKVPTNRLIVQTETEQQLTRLRQM